MKRKTLAVSLSAILAASVLFGCGSNSKSGDTKVLLTMVVPVPAHLIHPTREPDTGSVSVRWRRCNGIMAPHGDSEEGVLVDTIIPEFEKQYPNIHVSTVECHTMDCCRLLPAFPVGQADLMRMDIIWVPELAEMGALAA